MKSDFLKHTRNIVSLGEKLQTLLNQPDFSKSLHLKKTAFSSLNHTAKMLMRFQYSLVIDSIQNSEYDFNFDGWVQSVPLSNNGKAVVNFTFKNNSGSPVTGYFIGYINGVQLMPTNSFFENLIPGNTFKGVMTASGTPVGAGTVQLILVEGTPPYIKRARNELAAATKKAPDRFHQMTTEVVAKAGIPQTEKIEQLRPVVLISLEMPYFAGSPMSMASAIRSQLGITLTRDAAGNITNAQGTDLAGVNRVLNIKRSALSETPSIRFQYLEDSGTGQIPIYQIFAGVDGNQVLTLEIIEYPNGGFNTGHDQSELNYTFTPLDPTTIKIDFTYVHFPSAPGPAPGGAYYPNGVAGPGYAAYDIYKALAGQSSIPEGGDPSTATYIGDDISFDTYIPDFTKKVSFFSSIFPDDPITIADINLNTNATQNQDTGVPGLGVIRQAITIKDAATLTLYVGITSKIMCEGAKLSKVVWWAWAACLGTLAANGALTIAVAKLNANKSANKGGGPSGKQGDGTPGSPGTPTPFPSDAQCLVDIDCPDGFICLGGLCVPLGGGPVDQPVDQGE